jgi:membrane protein DedA with SNARE-associated domain
MFTALQSDLPGVIATYGYIAIAVIIALESMGLPLPGEAALVTASIYAGASHQLDIVGVIAAAVFGAAIGDNIGFWLGREVGFPLLLRYGRHVRLTEARIKLGKYLFLRHGGKIVFWGRFVALLRTLAAFLAGANQMEWRRFFVFNVAGGALWATSFATVSYVFGTQVHRFLGPVGIVAAVAAILGFVVFSVALRRQEARWQKAADRAFPEPLTVQRKP